MFEIYSMLQKSEEMLQKSEEAQLAHPVKSYTPKVWDYVALRLGNWLIDLGHTLKSQSIFSQFSKKHA